MKQLWLVMLTGMSALYLIAQTESTRPAKQVTVEDGGVSEALESIFIPPMPDAPFTCMLHTEWAHPMADGGSITLVNQRRIARQANGRFYQERWVLVPRNGPLESKMSHIQIADPNSHTLTTCAMWLKECKVANYGGKTTTAYQPEGEPSGPLPGGRGAVTNESLGKDVSERVETVGTRITRTLNAWAMGNDRPLSIVREFWFAPSLGMNLVSKVSDPRFGTQSFTVTDLVLGEPDPALFEIPKGFTLKDDRAPAAQQ
jgi:hypothetical protein